MFTKLTHGLGIYVHKLYLHDMINTWWANQSLRKHSTQIVVVSVVFALIVVRHACEYAYACISVESTKH